LRKWRAHSKHQQKAIHPRHVAIIKVSGTTAGKININKTDTTMSINIHINQRSITSFENRDNIF